MLMSLTIIFDADLSSAENLPNHIVEALSLTSFKKPSIADRILIVHNYFTETLFTRSELFL